MIFLTCQGVVEKTNTPAQKRTPPSNAQNSP
ncbi:hypothetical protein ACQ74_gp44 [Propionibacterium phage PHL095N00]|uniref:Uncharacterized protein n=1 Tax=Propionibacterium phage PHL095N00 TaxID=1500814 RepID=A0A0E3DMX7_9CAUD|nr:hypothetical protein ACQ74_gp44 [Propionibacterium phage PHL095N00]AII29352.1 hypothetical protein PHL095N00_44 [Propionibacterium phage PHL095N00]